MRHSYRDDEVVPVPTGKDIEELAIMADEVDEEIPVTLEADPAAGGDVPHINENAGRMFLDIQRELTMNTTFINNVTRVYMDMVNADKSGDREAFREHMTELLRMCDYNATLLAPIFFPSFTEDGPMTFWERPHAMAMMSVVPTGTLTVQASMAPLHGKPGVQKKVNCWKPKAEAMVISSQARRREGSETIRKWSRGQAASKRSTPRGDDIVRSAWKRAAGFRPGYGVASVLNTYTSDRKMFGREYHVEYKGTRKGEKAYLEGTV